MDTNTIEIVTVLANKVENGIGIMAEKAGVAVDYFWPLFVKQQMIEGIWTFASFFLLLAFIILLFILGRKGFEMHEVSKGYYTELLPVSWYKFICKFCAIVFLAFWVLALSFESKTAVSKIFNPEIAAIKEVATLIK